MSNDESANRNTLVKWLHENNGIPPETSREVIRALFGARTRSAGAIAEVVEAHGRLTLAGFGSFERKVQKSHRAFNVRTREMRTTSQRTRMVYRPGRRVSELFQSSESTKE